MSQADLPGDRSLEREIAPEDAARPPSELLSQLRQRLDRLAGNHPSSPAADRPRDVRREPGGEPEEPELPDWLDGGAGERSRDEEPPDGAGPDEPPDLAAPHQADSPDAAPWPDQPAPADPGDAPWAGSMDGGGSGPDDPARQDGSEAYRPWFMSGEAGSPWFAAGP